MFGNFSPNQNAVQKSPTYVKVAKYFGSKHFLSVKEGEMFNSNIIIWSLMLYVALSQCIA